MTDQPVKALTFDERYTEICFQVDKRRSKWDLAVVPWDDARQKILIHINDQLHNFDPTKGEFSHWVQTVISHKILNIWRDELAIYTRPCLPNVKNGNKKCAFNAGDDNCSATPSGKQCAECKIFKTWEADKRREHSIKQALPLENHSQEVFSTSSGFTSDFTSGFMDIEGKKKVIDQHMRKRLSKIEWKVYRLLMIRQGTERQAAKLLGFKDKKKTRTGRKRRTFNGYLSVLALRHKFVREARLIIAELDLA